MSGGEACKCPERQKPIRERLWECWDYKCNHSAFNGYHWTPSDYSAVFCTVCEKLWRTKAGWASEIHQGRDSAKKQAQEAPVPVQLNQDREKIIVRVEFQLKEGEDGYGPEISGIRDEIEKALGVPSCDSGTGFMGRLPTRDWGWPAEGQAAAEFFANTISSVMERRGYHRGDASNGGYMVTLFTLSTSNLVTFGE